MTLQSRIPSALAALVAGTLLALGPAAGAGTTDAAAAAAGRPAETTEDLGYGRSIHDYRTPNVRLTDSTGHEIDFASALAETETAIVGFIFTTCQGVCPVITANMARAVPELDRLAIDYRVFLVSLDPEYDTPARLSEYARRFRTGERVEFLTGASASVFEVLRAFNAVYLGGRKMNHQPVTLIRSGRDADWLRLDGLVDARSLAAEVARAAAADDAGAPLTAGR